ncbi:MAG: hypothetical protein ACRYFA_07085 [Janthinobacterium lividum]
MSALKSMMMAAAIMVATCVTFNASAATPTHMTQDTMKKGRMGKGKMGKMKKMKNDTTSKM